MAKSVLDGVMVIDFGQILAGPITTKYLAALGATVINIESTTRHNAIRATTPYKDNIPGLNRSGYFALYNANKYSITLDLKHPKGIEVVKRLIAKADIVSDNFVPGVMARLGLSYEDLKKIKPDIIMVSLSIQGQTEPYSQQRGLGTALAGFAGFTHITGWPDRDPAQVYGAVTDLIAPPFAVVGILGALLYRHRTGKGQYLDLSQNEASLQFLAPLLVDYLVNGKIAGRTGNSCAYAAPHGVYRCKGDDRWCAIAVFTDAEWEAFCRVLGNPAWAKHPKFSTLSDRKANEDELNKLVEAWTSNFNPEEVMTLMQADGVAAGIVQNSRDLIEDPQLKSRNYYRWLEHPEIGLCPHMGESFELSKTPVELRTPAPCLGEHNEYVCCQLLGMSTEEFAQLFAEGVFK